MIEKLAKFPRVHGNENGAAGEDIIDLQNTVNELVEASNRQDRVLAQLIHNGKGGLSQYLDPQDYEETMKAYKEDEDGT